MILYRKRNLPLSQMIGLFLNIQCKQFGDLQIRKENKENEDENQQKGVSGFGGGSRVGRLPNGREGTGVRVQVD